jgi:hypothetical protein
MKEAPKIPPVNKETKEAILSIQKQWATELVKRYQEALPKNFQILIVKYE